MLQVDYTYDYRPELDQYTWRRYFTDYPEFYVDGDSLEEATRIFRNRVRDIAIFAIDRKWITLNVSVSVESE
jgi:hypothetical protein